MNGPADAAFGRAWRHRPATQPSLAQLLADGRADDTDNDDTTGPEEDS